MAKRKTAKRLRTSGRKLRPAFARALSVSDDIPKSKTKKRKVAVDHGVQVYQVKCNRKCFPLVEYHCYLASDITTKTENVNHRFPGKERAVTIPNIMQTKELLFTIVTKGEIKEDLPLIVRKQNLCHASYENMTEKCHVSQYNTIQEAKGSSCCIVFEHSGVNIDVKAEVILRVSSQTSNKAQKDDRVMESDMTEQDIRKSLTHVLGEPLFSYAENIAERLKRLSNASAASPDPDGLVEQATQAAHALLNRKDTSRSSRSPQTGRIPDKVAVELHKLAADGVLAFGFFSTGMIVFVDETISGQLRRRRLDKKVKRACDPIDKSPRVEFTSRSFLRPTSIKQGGKLKNKTKGGVGTLGMVTRAHDRRAPDDQQKIVTALTSGHYFKEGDIAVGFIDAQNEIETDLGPCIATLLGSTDVAVIKISESDTYSFNFCDENDKLCNCVPMRQEMKMHDIVYKRGDISGLTKGYIQSPDFQVINSENTVRLGEPVHGYIIQGDNQTTFAVLGDSGSVVFSPDLEDTEKETVQIVSIQSSTIEIQPGQNVSYTVRADRCFEKLRDEKQIEMIIPKKQDMD